MVSRVAVPVSGLFEAHLMVADLDRSIFFYGNTVGLELAHTSSRPASAFFWVGGSGRAMLGLWEAGPMPFHMGRHVAFQVSVSDLLEAPERLKRAGVTARDFHGHPADEPVVLAWMPAASIYFHDPDGNLLEFISMLPEPPRPALGVVRWSDWQCETVSHR